MVVPDARKDARFADNPLVTGAPHIRFTPRRRCGRGTDSIFGTLCVIDTKPRRMTKSSAATLASLATFVVAELQLRYEIGERRRATDSLRLLQAASSRAANRS